MPLRYHQSFVALYIIVVLLTVSVEASDYTAAGGCQYATKTACIGGCANLRVTTTVPQNSGDAGCPAAPHPLIFFFNGLQVPSTANQQYVTKLASYGYAVVQYDTTPLVLIPDEVELPIMRQVLDLLQKLSSSNHEGFYNKVDFSWIGVAGYSRGGKLAALHLARNSSIRTAYLIDPVDSTAFTPNFPGLNPAAPRELRKAEPQRTAAVIGGGITAICNPDSSGYEAFFQVLGPGSWLHVMPGASHLSFADAPLRYMPVCGWESKIKPQDVMSIASALGVAWFEHVRTGQAPSSDFVSWRQNLVESGSAEFTEK